eukprot:2393939-Pyramimonas_sp.AAC.1
MPSFRRWDATAVVIAERIALFCIAQAGRAKYHHVDKRQFNTLRDLADEGVEMARAELSRAGPVG